MSWSNERVELLRKLHEEGLTASQIAKKLGDVTRNAVIGKLNRLGISNKSKMAAAKKTNASKDAEAARKADMREEPNAPAEDPGKSGLASVKDLNGQQALLEKQQNDIAKAEAIRKKSKKLSLMELTEKTCKWPYGDPATSNFFFCGLPVAPGKPYCEVHVALAYQPPTSRRR
ncbi:MAG: GcrA cell cycle regulator [Roseovarius sp.]|nr:GcrA cell cycle regulator [Roseovarius sp.]MCY4290949.1 GcrA cell cycle regulator [Roseovarius sp.]